MAATLPKLGEGVGPVVVVDQAVQDLAKRFVVGLAHAFGIAQLFVLADVLVDLGLQVAGLGLQDMDHAPEQFGAVLCYRGAVGCDACGEDIDDLRNCVSGVVRIVDFACVELVLPGSHAMKLGAVHDKACVGRRLSIGGIVVRRTVVFFVVVNVLDIWTVERVVCLRGVVIEGVGH